MNLETIEVASPLSNVKITFLNIQIEKLRSFLVSHEFCIKEIEKKMIDGNHRNYSFFFLVDI